MLTRPLVALALVLAPGCGSPDGTFADGSADLARDLGGCDCLGPDGPPPPATARVSGICWDDANDAPSAGTTICLYLGAKKTQTCTQTDPSGYYAIDVPTGTPIILGYQRQGYQHVLLPLQLTGSLGLGRLGVYPDAEAKTYYAAAKATYPPTIRGDLLINCAAGTTVTIAPKKGLGPVYDDVSHTPDPTLSKSEGGDAMIFDLDPGTYDVTCVHPGLTCEARTGWPSTKGHAKVPVLAGACTGVTFSCSK